MPDIKELFNYERLEIGNVGKLQLPHLNLHTENKLAVLLLVVSFLTKSVKGQNKFVIVSKKKSDK